MKTFFLILNFFTIVFSSDVVHDDTYYKYSNNNTEIIFSKENLKFAKRTDSIEDKLHKYYQDTYNWKLDETLYIGLLSHKNQIPNGYSSQWPNNRQINYMGGVQNIDYFCSTSWLDTLLYHESAHNYQVNVKASGFSRFLHKIFGNGLVMFPLPLSVPNVLENSFMLEGNAVLNESWHGNGGRLYSGRFKAQTILQAKAANITPQLAYNTTLEFPYSETYYITGGFYNLYMAEKYGLNNLNRYFKQHSKLFIWPQLTNHSMKVVTGDNFENSLKEFADNYAKKELHVADGKKLFSSKFYYQLNSDKDEIYFIINESGLRAPELVVIDKDSLHVKKESGSWIGGRVVKKDGFYYSVGYNYTSAFNIYQGLYDSDSDILDSSRSKIIQGYLSDKRAVYFDINTSFSQARLYVGNEFYSQVNSSVFIDENDNIYYFKQRANLRTLYKNKSALYSYKGFYGIVNDVDKNGDIYFVANTKNGSSLYKYSNTKVNRVHEADNILEAKLLRDNKVFLSAVGSDEYYYLVSDLKEIEQGPYETKLFFEDKEYYAKLNYENLDKYNTEITLDKEYNSLLDMHYIGTDFLIGSTSENNVIGNINISFGDPLGQNEASFLLNRDDSNITISGISYASKQFFLNYSFLAYTLVEDNNRTDVRDYGLMLNANIPFIRFSKYYADLGLSFYQDYETKEREPLSLTLALERYEQYGKSLYPNYLNSLGLYGVKERDDFIYGASYNFSHDLPHEFYFGIGAKYSKTDSRISSLEAGVDTRGVKVSNDSTSIYDKSHIQMPNLGSSIYLRSASYAEIELSKVINFSKYFFTFPLSIQRESIYTKYRYYQLESFSDNLYNFNEYSLGLNLSLVGLNSLAFPIMFEYTYNDDKYNIVDSKNKFRLLLGVEF